MKKKQTVQELLRLCCAVCGPLSREEVGQFFSPGVVVEALGKTAPLLRLATQPDYPRLKRIYEGAPALQRLCEAVMARRSAEQLSYRSAIPEDARCISAARYALVQGNAMEFQRLHRLYRGIPRLGAPPEAPRMEFWDGVLGEAWLGSDLLPAGVAREEIRVLVAKRYLLQPLPEDMKMDAETLPALLRLGWGMLRADMHLKPTAAAQAAEDETADEIALAARAYWNTWAGSWENAQRAFLRLFRSREAQALSVAVPYGVGLLLMGCIVAIRAHAPERTVSLWIRLARDIALSALPEPDSDARVDLCSFFDSLSLWDSIENRGSRHFSLPPHAGALGSIPLAMGARAIVRNTGVELPLTRLIEDILAVHARGLHLLAFYAATALAYAPGVTEEDIAALSDVRKCCSFKPLFNRSSKKKDRVPDLRLEQLITIVDSQRGSAPRWLYWDVALDRQGVISRIEPRLVERRPQSAGQKLELEAVTDPTLLDCQDKRDLAVVALVRSLQSEQLRGIPLLAEALVGHPRVRLIEGSYHRVVQVEATRPIIRTALESFSLKLTLDARQFYRLRVEESRLTIPAFSARMQSLVDYFSHGPISIDLARVEQARWLIARLAEYFTFEGPMPDSLMEYTPSTPQFIIHSSVYDNGYLFDLDVKHHPSCSEYDMPGKGERALLLTVEGEPTCIIRDFEEEISAACALVDRCPTLCSTKSEDYQWLFLSAGEALQAMQELGAQGVRMQWQATPALEIIEPQESSLRLRVLAEHADWLEIGADLPVEEQLVLSLSELLELYERRSGSFLPLGGARYLHLPAELEEQVQRLAESVHREQNKNYALPLAALPGFVSEWQGAALPAALVERQAVLGACDRAPVPAGFVGELRDYQLAGFRWLLARARAGLGACLADDMGLGKSVQTLALMLELAAEGPSLIIAPASLSTNWQAESARFAPSLRVFTWAQLKSDPQPLSAGDALVTTYGQLVANEAYFLGTKWNVIVLDEAQYIKNPASRRAQVACRLSASYRLALTGTPVENSLLDLWSIMHFLNPALLGSRASFAHAERGDTNRIRRRTAPLILRRRKEEVLPQLPPISEVVISVDLSAEERALYESCRRRAVSRVRSGSEPLSLLAELTRLRRLCCHGKLALESFTGDSSKLKSMAQLVEDLLAADHSVLIFSQFTDVLDLAQETLEDLGYCTLRLDGATPPAQRGEHVRLFQEGAARIFLISLKAGGVGLNLTAADYVILLDPWWNPAAEAQAASRSHRLGQNNPVTLCRLIARDTIEERIMQMHEAKQALAESVIHEGAMPLETLQELLLQC